MISINKNAMRVVREILADPEALGCGAIRMGCGATLIDMGLNTKGSWQAGLLFARATLGDLGMVSFGDYKVNERYSFSSIEVFVEQPMIACMGSQIAGWQLGKGDFAAIGSGPARALAVVETDRYFKMTPYRDRHDEAVLCIQSNSYPSEEVATYVAKACGVKPENTYLLLTSNTSTVCSIQVCARVIEQVCHKMFEKGFDPAQIVVGRGRAPIAPVCNDPVKTMGRMNDAILYGGETEFWVDTEDTLIAKTIHRLTSNTSSPNYGELFMDIFERSGRDFYRMDYDVHSIAKIQIHNVRTGKAFCAGEINYRVLEKSFLS
ncbi:MAG: methenyltetrahydromethanopterin cyclohydrolase [Bacillota bacterium]